MVMKRNLTSAGWISTGVISCRLLSWNLFYVYQ